MSGGFTEAIAFLRGMVAGMEAVAVCNGQDRQTKTDMVWELISALERGFEWRKGDNDDE